MTSVFGHRSVFITGPLPSHSAAGPAQFETGRILNGFMLSPGKPLLALWEPEQHQPRSFYFSSAQRSLPRKGGRAACSSVAFKDKVEVKKKWEWSTVACKSETLSCGGTVAPRSHLHKLVHNQKTEPHANRACKTCCYPREDYASSQLSVQFDLMLLTQVPFTRKKLQNY